MAIFSEDELRHLINGFSLYKNASTSRPENDITPVPCLSGDGFLSFGHMYIQLLAHLADENHAVLPLKTLSEHLDVGQASLHHALSRLSGVNVFSADKKAIFTEYGKKELLDQIVQQANNEILILSDVCNEKNTDERDLEALINLTKAFPSQSQLHVFTASPEGPNLPNRRPISQTYIYSYRYGEMIEIEIRRILTECMEKLETIEISSTHFPGCPPASFLYATVKNYLENIPTESGGTLTYQANKVIFVSSACYSYQRDQLLKEIRSGTTPIFKIDTLTATRLNYTLENLREYLQKNLGDEGVIWSDYALSKTWLDSQVKDLYVEIVKNNYACLSDNKHIADTQLDLSEQIKEYFGVHLKELAQNSAEPFTISILDGYFVQEHLSMYLTEMIKTSSRELAQEQWSNSSSDTTDFPFTIDEVVSFHKKNSPQKLPPPPLLNQVMDYKIVGLARSAHSSEITRLTLSNETEFGKFWTEKITSRYSLHKTGIGSIRDEKLRCQLSDLLKEYFVKELIPDSIEKAKKKKLMRSKKTKRSLQKLPSDMSTLSVEEIEFHISKLSKSCDAAGDKRNKGVYLELISNRLPSKLKEAPQMYLTLIITLFAAHYPGVVYVTGKFAPKLMRQLKENLAEKEYARLELLKDGVKSGKIGDSEMQEMRQWIEGAVESTGVKDN